MGHTGSNEVSSSLMSLDERNMADTPAAASHAPLSNNHITLSDDAPISMTKFALQHELHIHGGKV
eukprot:11739917-Ditylum_brightwellii.AAC.1